MNSWADGRVDGDCKRAERHNDARDSMKRDFKASGVASGGGMRYFHAPIQSMYAMRPARATIELDNPREDSLNPAARSRPSTAKRVCQRRYSGDRLMMNAMKAMRQTELGIDFAADASGASAHLHRRMPPPQYLGAKHKLLPWLCAFIPDGVETVLDGFSGSQSFAYHMKQRGHTVHSNDFLAFCGMQGVALIENKRATLTDADVDMLFSENHRRADVMRRFSGIFFAEQECALLDNFRANVELLDGAHKRALALAVMCRSLTRKTTMGHFAHLQAIPYANNPARVKRNPSIAKPIRELFMALLPAYNAAVFDNRRQNKSHHANILDLLPKLRGENIDLAYYDPPYCNSHADYQSFYHLLETFVENWSDADKEFINRNRRYHPSRHSGFDKLADIENSFRRLFELSDEIPHWLISYNDRSRPTIDTLAGLARRHKSVRVEQKTYAAARGGRGSVSGSREYLIVCSP